MSRSKKILYGVILAVLCLLAYFAFKTPDTYGELLKTEAVTEGTEEALDVVRRAVKAIDGKNKGALKKLVQVANGGAFYEMTDLMFYAKVSPYKVLGCNRMVNSSVKGNLSVIVRSESRKQNFRFCLLKTKRNQYRIYSISLTEEDPSKDHKEE